MTTPIVCRFEDDSPTKTQFCAMPQEKIHPSNPHYPRRPQSDKQWNYNKHGDYYHDDADAYSTDSNDERIYIVKQRYGYFSILFSLVQAGVLAAMMWQCGIAPLAINPMVGPYPDALDYWGAKNAVLIVEDSEHWRLMTPILLHAGVIHLLGNIGVQLESGAFFEREWGSGVWLVVYLCSALSSSLLSCIFMPNSLSVGSSGAVMGLFGAKLSEIFCRCCESADTQQGKIGHDVRNEQFGGVMCSVIIVGLFSFIPYVDWAAHLGGLVGGQIVGMLLFSSRIRTIACAIWWCLVGFAMSIIGYAMAIMYLYTNVQPMDELRDVCGYYQQFFEDYECNCQLN